MKKLLILLMLLPTIAFGRKFYISSSSGSDTYTYLQAQSSSTPWKSLTRLQQFVNTANAYPNFPAAGDTFAFKCNDVFTNGYNNATWPGALVWWGNNRAGGWIAPSGTTNAPIVFTYYGSGVKPNFLFAVPGLPAANSRFIFNFSSVSNIVVDGLQFNDTRFPVNDKVSSAYTAMGVNIEGSGAALCTNIVVKNCYFNNIGYGISAFANNVTISNNKFTNMKNVGDTSGQFDIGAVPILVSGKKHRITNNYLKGGWAYTSGTASGQGLNGGGIEILNDFDSSFIGYNTIIDCDGFLEMGNTGGGTGVNAPNDDTIAYNLVVNSRKIAYINQSLTSTARLRFYNNVLVENQWSRFSGPAFGTDVFNDGQSFAQFPSWPTWPQNTSTYNYGGSRPIQYPGDQYYTVADTLIDSRNNIFWITSGLQALYANTYTKYKHANNVYHIAGSYTYPSALGGTLNTTAGQVEYSTTAAIIADSTSTRPEDWNYRPLAGAVINNAGSNVGIAADFSGNAVTNPPDIGLLEAQVTTVPVVTTNAITSITKFTAVAGGNVVSDGGSPVTARGVVWTAVQNTSPDTRLKGQYRSSGSGTGSFSLSYIAPLLPGTTYYVRAYATNANGTTYGAPVTFTTTAAGTAQKYYFSSSTGSDSYDGKSPTPGANNTGPWKTLVKLQQIITNGNVTFQPGDTIFFKRGDTFDNGYYAPGDSTGFYYVSCSWMNIPESGYTAPSGKDGSPIVLTNYGTGSLPNFIYPEATMPQHHNTHNTFQFDGVNWIVIDGLQFNDTRFPVTDKSNPAYTRSSLIFGEWIYSRSASLAQGGKYHGWNTDPIILGSKSDPYQRWKMNANCTVKNCYFTNTSFAFGSVGCSNSLFTNNTIVNMKSCVDTIGTFDVMAGAFDAVNGFNNTFSYNYMEGIWGKSGRNSSCQGMGGVAFNVFSIQNSKFVYNTVIDGRHFIEIGDLDGVDPASGAQYDTIAFNKIVGNFRIGYLHGGVGDPFTGNVHHIHIWNNAVIENNSSRQSGPNFGYDRKGDGISFNQFWFFGNKDLTTGYNSSNSATLSTTSYNITFSGTTAPAGIKVGSTVYGPEGSGVFGSRLVGVPNRSGFAISEDLYATVTAVNNNIVTLDKLPLRAGMWSLTYYPPLADKGITWSQPQNVASRGYYGTFDNANTNTRMSMQYSTDNTLWGQEFDTLVDMKNNIFYNTTGLQMIYDVSRTRFKHYNNMYYLVGGYSGYSSRLGTSAALGTGEKIYTTNIFKDTSAALPENWNLVPVDTSYAYTGGSTIPGLTKDFAGNTITGSFIGLYKYVAPVSSLAATSTYTPIICNGGTSTVTVSATGGTPPYTGIGQFVRGGGAYSYTVRDAANNTALTTNTIPEPIAITITTQAGSIACNGGSTDVVVSATGGTSPYTGTGTFSKSAGTYTFTVTDANNCTATASVTLTQPTLLNAGVSSGTIAVNGGSTTVTVAAVGGTAPYQYNIDGGAYQSNTTFSGILAGTHTVITKDANNCTTSNIVTISQPAPINRRSRLYFINAQ